MDAFIYLVVIWFLAAIIVLFAIGLVVAVLRILKLQRDLDGSAETIADLQAAMGGADQSESWRHDVLN